MPEISRFFGISIKMFFGDHLPPLFHAEYGEFKAQVNIQSLVIIAGDLPPRVLGMVVEWGSQHKGELKELWELASKNEPLHRIDPLK
jgi:hypothetical protein